MKANFLEENFAIFVSWSMEYGAEAFSIYTKTKLQEQDNRNVM